MSEPEQDHPAASPPDHNGGAGFDRRAFLRRTALGGMAVGGVSTLLDACGSSASTGSAASSVFGSAPNYKFVFVNQATTSPLFTATQYGAADACKLLGCSYRWTGAEGGGLQKMVTAVNTAVAEKADGIAVALIDRQAFNAPVEAALKAGIPVVAYNVDAPGNARLAYIGQDLQSAGELMGDRVVADVPSGHIGLFVSAPQTYVQPRITGAIESIIHADRKEGKSITIKPIATGETVAQSVATLESFWQEEQKIVKGMYAVDAVTTESVAKVMKKFGLAAKGIKAGGFEVAGEIPQLLREGNLEFTIEQQLYLQGFLPILQMFLWHASGSLTGPAETDTGAKFLNKDTIAPYLENKSRYEGTSSEVKVIPIKAGTPA